MVALLHEDSSAPGGVAKVTINLGPQDWLEEGHEDRGKVHLIVNVGRPVGMVPGEEMIQPFAVPIRKPLPGGGSYTFSFELDRSNNEVERIAFRALPLPPMGMFAAY